MLGKSETSPLYRGVDEELRKFQEVKAKVEGWRSTVLACMNDLNEYRRTLSEIKDLQPRVEQGEGNVKALGKDLETSELEAKESVRNESALRDLQEITKRWRDHAGRIEEQSAILQDKEDALQCETAGSVGEGTLDDVEEALRVLQDEQAALYDKINKKNKKISQTNTDISASQRKAKNTNDLLSKKEEQYAQEQKAWERKQQLEDRKTAVSQEISKVSGRPGQYALLLNGME